MDMNGRQNLLSPPTFNIVKDNSVSIATNHEERRSFSSVIFERASPVFSRRSSIYSSVLSDTRYTTTHAFQTSPAQSSTITRAPSGLWSRSIRALIKFIIFLCKSVILLDPIIKVCIYLACVLLIPVMGDYMPSYSRPYFAQRDNVFNIYFVKIGWLLTLFLSLPFVSLTSYTISCGDMSKMLLHHLPRLAIGTFFWFTWTSIFNLIAKFYGSCSNVEYDSSWSCRKAGYIWHTFDISGHTFILMHSSLVFIEETRPLMHWECIERHLNTDINGADNPLATLTQEELAALRSFYPIATPILHALFVIIAGFQLLWDVMLLGTMLYHHTKLEKIISGFIAIFTWYLTYRLWYHWGVWPQAASNGCFCYNMGKSTPNPLAQQLDNVADAATNVANAVTQGVRESIQLTQDFLSLIEEQRNSARKTK